MNTATLGLLFPDRLRSACFSAGAVGSPQPCSPHLCDFGLEPVSRRQACPRFLRQTFPGHAGESIRHSRWARAYYQQQRDRGKKHDTIARSLAFKWQRILLRCWRDRVVYDESRYLAALSQRRSPLARTLHLAA